MAKDLGIRFIRRTIKPIRTSNPGTNLASYYEWWNKDIGWCRDQLDASLMMADEVGPVLRALKMENDPRVIQTIAVPLTGR